MKELKTLADLFEKRIFRIPDYQRGYAWGEKQLVEFWEDIITLNDDRLHYTGVISIKEVESPVWKKWNDEEWLISKRKYSPFFVVDGQQRLTTSIIFLQTLIELVQSVPGNKEKKNEEIFFGTYSLKEIIENYIYVSQPPNNIIKSYKFGYETDNPSFEFLRHKILMEPLSGTIEETFYTLNLENAKKFFQVNLKKLFDEEGLNAIESIYEKLTLRLMFNVYEIDEKFDVFVAFETMNNRGKQLSNLELLKNRLIYLTSLYKKSEVKENEIKKVRANINKAWKEVYHQLGRNKRNPLNDNDFLRAHWIMYFKYSRKKGNDYIRFLLDDYFNPKNIFQKVLIQKDILESVVEVVEESDQEDIELENGVEETAKLNIKEIDRYVASLQDAAKFWHITHFPFVDDITEYEQIWLDKLNRVGINYFRPLVLSSFTNKTVTPEQRVALFKSIERFIFLVFRIKRQQSNWASSDFYRAAKSLYWGELSIDQVIGMLEGYSRWMFDENEHYFKFNEFYDFIHKKFKTENSGFYGWNDLRYFLFEYEEFIRPEKRDVKLNWFSLRNEGSNISIEHILPQTDDNDYWHKYFNYLTDEKKNFLKGSLGNLLTLSMSINSSLQNDGFDEKKKVKIDANGKTIRNGYENGSYSEQEVAKHEIWDAMAIKQRGIKMLNFMEERWDIKFKDEEDKTRMLHIDFMIRTKFPSDAEQ